MMENLSLFNVALGVAGAYALKKLYIAYTPSGHPPLPPGPKAKPVIGNLLDMPPPGTHEWQHWRKHKDLYGPISAVSVLGMTIVIINDYSYASELLEKKASITSDRPSSVFGGEMCGWENSLAMACHGERFKAIRKGMHQAIGSGTSLRKYHPLEETEARRFLLRVMEKPSELYDHIRRTTGAIILSISHGYAIEQAKPDPLVTLADECMAEASLAFAPGSWIVDFVPALRYLPDGFPGTNFKKVARRFFAHVMELLEKPHAFTKQQLATGHVRPSFTQEMLEKGNVTPEEESIIKWAAAAIYGGGSDTTVSTTYSFYLAMVLYPEILKKAQAEIDSVIGTDRLPTIEDRPRLPYINALVKESLRWNTVLPMGIPHVLQEDTVFKGYFLPKGTLVMANLSQLAHDSSTYKDPMDFKPERFLDVDGNTSELDPKSVVFGFGRRVCPGRELADLSLYVLISMSLAAFNISKAVDASGDPIEAKNEWTPGLISRPKEFICSITPRSEKAAALIRSVEYDQPLEKSDAETILNLKWDNQLNKLL